ncbi:hypothetical protein [Oxynema aestuarii]|jgi:hypothetical protein|uniref:DUF4268 domain-containing protein n=1 Tax=Oxynema aestuarii AP17 TaxID=2064643 RepID=A0A6H1TV28_9CYAN|nr:hypothetical protein [Oxynema aestuarii]QIZ70066.1 hypothetical protein HCG48_05360 [Oxynema aestuarii AP17]RMH78864.1 MAG: hypothetical protein D6680_00955 [Cyanobacteria bacterium J007]
MGGGIYLIQDEDRLVEMLEQAYDSEDRLEELLEKYPNLVAGDRVDRETPRQWLLISREIPLPSEEEGMQLWTFEHLFLDQNAIPTLVEVKRTSESRVRRETIGQMLDYAANVSLYWPLESIVAQFEANCRDGGRDPEQVFEEFLGSDADEERFWQKVKTNLQAGKLRLVFVADEIAPELRRVVEFLNEQLDPTEVLALEIKQYVSQDGLRTLVPRVIGQTAEAQQKKTSATRERRRWNEASFFQEFEARQGTEEAVMARKIHEWVRGREPQVEVVWGTGDTYGGFTAKLKQKGRKPLALFTVGISGEFFLSSIAYGSQPPFDREEKWLELRGRMSSIGLSLPADPTETRLPTFPLSTLQDDSSLEQVLETFEWAIAQIQSHPVSH